MKQYDILIVGSGPAGATLAKELSEHNLKVLLIEKYSLPRNKPCAGGLPYHINELLDFSIDEVIRKEAIGTIFTYNLKKKVKLESEEIKIKMVMRSEFDYLLVKKAIEAGTEVIDNCEFKNYEIDTNDEIIVTTNKEKFKTKFLIGADGAFSPVAKKAGLLKNRILGWALNAEVYVSDKQLKNQNGYVNVEMGLVPKGYAWIFPKDDHLSCGVGIFMQKIPNFKEYLYKYLENHPNTKNFSKCEIKGYPLPISYEKNLKINTNNVLLVGDAASLVEPLSGEGIYFAIKSAKIAAKHLSYHFQFPNSLDSYSKEINETLRIDLYYAYKFAKIFYKFPKLVYKLGVSNPYVNKNFQELLVGKKTYKDLYFDLKEKFSGKFTQKAISSSKKIINKIKNNKIIKKLQKR